MTKLQSSHLIQIGTIRRPLGDYTQAKISDAVNMEYMGAAEFEFGALPKSLRSIEAKLTQVRVRVVDEIKDKEGKSLRVLHCFDTETMDEYVEVLKNLRANKVRTKECHYFEETYVPGRFTQYDYWWDIRNHVMWSFDKNFMNRLKGHIESSLKYMNT